MSASLRIKPIGVCLAVLLTVILTEKTAAATPTIEILSNVPRDVQTEDLLDFLEHSHFDALHPKRKSLPKNRFTDRMAFRAACRPLIEAYARHGKQYGLRWDYAVFQMMHETDSLRYTGQADPANNNFAGIGVTGDPKRWRIEGDKFATVNQGVLAHVQHLAAYAGAFDRYRNEVEQRIQELQRRKATNASLEKSLREGGVPAEVLAALSKKLKPAVYASLLIKRAAAVEIAVKHGIVAPRTRFTWYHDIHRADTFAGLAGRWAADKQYGEKLREYAADFATIVNRRRKAERAAGTDLRPWIGNWRITSRHTYGAYRNVRADSEIRMATDRNGRLQVMQGHPARIVAATPTRLRYTISGGVNSVTVELFRDGKTVKGNFSGSRRQDGKPVGGVISVR